MKPSSVSFVVCPVISILVSTGHDTEAKVQKTDGNTQWYRDPRWDSVNRIFADYYGRPLIGFSNGKNEKVGGFGLCRQERLKTQERKK